MHGPQTRELKAENQPASPTVTLTAEHPSNGLLVTANILSSDSGVLEVSITKVVNPSRIPVVISVTIAPPKWRAAEKTHTVFAPPATRILARPGHFSSLQKLVDFLRGEAYCPAVLILAESLRACYFAAGLPGSVQPQPFAAPPHAACRFCPDDMNAPLNEARKRFCS